MSEYIEREYVKVMLKRECSPRVMAYLVDELDKIPAADVRPVPEGGIGEMSDGYHTFNGLYYQRMVLFAALVKAHKDRAWKSLRHEDGELCFGGGWFIVGIDTPQGSYTYHYEDKDWNLFDCVELPVAKHWDGHTEEDVTRLLSLDVRPVVMCRDCRHRDPEDHKCDSGEMERQGCPFPVDDDYYCAYGVKREEPQTNADRIRAMSDEELAELWWERVDCGECPVHKECKLTGQDCKRLALTWLKQEGE